MSIGTIHGIYTLVFMTAFILMAIWVFVPRRKDHYEDAANLPFADGAEQRDDKTPGSTRQD